MRGIYFFVFLLISLTATYALDSVVVKLDPNYVETYGEPVYFKIYVENIPPRGSLGVPDLYNDASKIDGGCGGVDITVNYSPEYLKPLEFNWSEEFKDIKLKEYRFENGTFYLSILFSNSPKEGNIYLGTLAFIPIKEGETTLNISGVVSSEHGIKYSSKNRYYIDYGKASQRIAYYPDTKFQGATVVIKGVSNYTNYSTRLEGTFNESDVLDEHSEFKGKILCKIINNITVTPNFNTPEVVVKEVDIVEKSPNITLVINTSVDYRLLIFTFLGSLISGVLFGAVIKWMRIV